MTQIKAAERLGRKIWLFGLGAAASGRGRALQYVDGWLEQTQKLRDDLIQEGVDVEAKVKTSIKIPAPLTQPLGKIQSVFTIPSVKESELDLLEAKVTKLSETIDALVAAKKKPATRARKTTSPKSSTVKSKTLSKPKVAAAPKPTKANTAGSAKTTSTRTANLTTTTNRATTKPAVQDKLVAPIKSSTTGKTKTTTSSATPPVKAKVSPTTPTLSTTIIDANAPQKVVDKKS
jgi:hypothetical protein